MTPRRTWLTAGFVSLAIGVLLQWEAHASGPLWGEEHFLRWLQARPGSLPFAKAVRTLTSTEPIVGAGAGAALVAWRLRARRLALVTALLFLALPLLQTTLKELASRPRPEPPTVELRAGFTSPSFPAGHAMSAVVGYGWAVVLSSRRRRRSTWRRRLPLVGFFATLAATSWANLWTGVHWPTDIVGGAAWGTVLLASARLSLDSGRKGRRPAS